MTIIATKELGKRIDVCCIPFEGTYIFTNFGQYYNKIKQKHDACYAIIGRCPSQDLILGYYSTEEEAFTEIKNIAEAFIEGHKFYKIEQKEE